jgi:hypothetical protein
MEEYWEVWESTTDVRRRREQFDKLKAFVTTYGNARALEAAEKVEKGVPAEVPTLAVLAGGGSKPSEYYRAGENWGSNNCRQATLDHIAKVKSELK